MTLSPGHLNSFRRCLPLLISAVLFLALVPTGGTVEKPRELREGTRAFYRGDHLQAASMARSYLRRHPRDIQALILLARTESAQGRHEDAFENLRQALRIDPQNIDALYFLGKLCRSLAQAQLQELFATAPDSAWAHYFLAESYVAEGLPEKALDEYQAALKVNPRSVEILSALADIERAQYRLDEAVAHYSRALDINPNDFNSLYGLGVTYLRRQELPRAIEYLRRSVSLDANSGVAHLALGMALLRSGDAAAAARELMASITLEPQIWQAHLHLARAYQALGQSKEAEKALEKASQLRRQRRDAEALQLKAITSGQLPSAPAVPDPDDEGAEH